MQGALMSLILYLTLLSIVDYAQEESNNGQWFYWLTSISFSSLTLPSIKQYKFLAGAPSDTNFSPGYRIRPLLLWTIEDNYA